MREYDVWSDADYVPDEIPDVSASEYDPRPERAEEVE